MAIFFRRRLAEINEHLANGIAIDQFERTKQAQRRANQTKQEAHDLVDVICDVFEQSPDMDLPPSVRTLHRLLQAFVTTPRRRQSIAALTRKIRLSIRSEY